MAQARLPENLKEGHLGLINRMNQLGHHFDSQGICFGLTMTGGQAYLKYELYSFDATITLIDSIPTKVFAEKIRNEQHHLLIKQIPIFSRVVKAYQDRSHYPTQFEIISINENTQEPVLVPVSRPYFLNVYDKQKLTKSLDELKNAFDKPQYPIPARVGFLLSNLCHVVFIGYDSQEKEWTFIDANHLPSKRMTNHDELATWIISASASSFAQPSSDDQSIFVAHYWPSEKGASMVNQVFGHLLRQPSWKAVNKIKLWEVDKRDGYGCSLLSLAVKWNHLTLVTTLLDAGADPEQIDLFHFLSPLYMSVYCGHIEMTQLLINRRANVHYKNKQCRGLLHVAIQQHGKLEIVRALIEGGIAIDTVDLDGYTPLHLAIWFGLKEIVVFLLKQGGNLNLVKHESEGQSLSSLCLAIFRGHAEIVNLLLQAGADPDYVSDNKITPLDRAIQAERIDIVESLLRYGAIIPPATQEGVSLLHYAAQYGHMGIIQALLQRGVDPHLLTPEGKTPLQYAQAAGQIEAVNCLLLAGATSGQVIESHKKHKPNFSFSATTGMLFSIGYSPKKVEILKSRPRKYK